MTKLLVALAPEFLNLDFFSRYLSNHARDYGNQDCTEKCRPKTCYLHGLSQSIGDQEHRSINYQQ